LKKLMIVAATLALVLGMAVPALAQVSEGLAERSTTGNFNATFTANSTGNNSNQCVTPLQFGNTAPQQNAQGALQYGSTSSGAFGGLDFTGPTFTFAPELTAPCEPKVEQSSAASSQQDPVSSPQQPVDSRLQPPVSSPSTY
jgi:hypothetical protein